MCVVMCAVIKCTIGKPTVTLGCVQVDLSVHCPPPPNVSEEKST